MAHIDMGNATIRQAIRMARKVFILADPGYDDFIAPFRVPTTKAAALELVRRAPKDRLPTAYWEDGDDLVLMPQADLDHD